MKKTLILFVTIVTAQTLFAQDYAIIDKLLTRFDDVEYFANNQVTLYSVFTKGKVGIYDARGRELLPPIYDSVYYTDYNPNNEVFTVLYNGKFQGLCNGTGKIIIPIDKYNTVGLFGRTTHLIHVTLNDKQGVCDDTGREIISPIKYTKIRESYSDYDSKIGIVIGYEVFVNKKHGWCDSNGTEVVEPVYDMLISPSENLITVCKNNKWGYVSSVDGKIMVPLDYEDAGQFHDGVALVTKNGKKSLLPNPLLTTVQNTSQSSVKGRAVSTFPAPDSDVDKNIPTGKKADNNTHTFIIANENYPVAKVPYALNDGWMFEQYCKKTLGIKEENVHLFEDATGGNIVGCVEQMKQVAKTANGQATIIFYYAGHAFPDEEKSTAYLLPIDGDSKNPSTGYSLERLYKEMNSVQVKQMVCFLDACFSGATRDDQMLITGRGVTIKVKDEIPQGNMVVMTSATGAETAHSFEEMHHGLFTYYLLQKLQETKGDVTLGDLSEYVTKMVKRKSVLVNQKKQTPTVIPSPQLQGTWQGMKL